MDNMIIVDLTLFSDDQVIFIQKNGEFSSQKTTMLEAADDVVALCHKHDINTVKISGITVYANEIMKEIELKERIKYSENNIKVEVL